MATNETTEPIDEKGDASTAIAIVLPSLFAIVLVILLAVAFILPRMTSRQQAAIKEERKKKRMARLEECLKAQRYVDWSITHRPRRDSTGGKDDASTASDICINPLCVICLDEISDSAQVRPLNCRHIFHRECLDDWFARWNEYCPLCHRPIIPGTKQMERKRAGHEEPPLVAFLV